MKRKKKKDYPFRLVATIVILLSLLCFTQSSCESCDEKNDECSEACILDVGCSFDNFDQCDNNQRKNYYSCSQYNCESSCIEWFPPNWCLFPSWDNSIFIYGQLLLLLIGVIPGTIKLFCVARENARENEKITIEKRKHKVK